MNPQATADRPAPMPGGARFDTTAPWPEKVFALYSFSHFPRESLHPCGLRVPATGCNKTHPSWDESPSRFRGENGTGSRLILRTCMNEKRRLARVRIKARRSGSCHIPVTGRADKPPIRSHASSPGGTSLLRPTTADWSSVRGFMIRRGWLRLFYAIISGNCAPPT